MITMRRVAVFPAALAVRASTPQRSCSFRVDEAGAAPGNCMITMRRVAVLAAALAVRASTPQRSCSFRVE
jgi:hypothetical protein